MAFVEKKIFELTKSVKPLNYRIVLKPVVEKNAFEAEAEIRVKIHEPTNEICMHAHKLTIKECIFKVEHLNKSFKPEKVVLDAERHMVRLFFGAQMLPVGLGLVHIKYEGIIHEKNNEGVYFNRWGNSKQMEKTFLMTGLEHFKAHYAFPCIDEPWAKATFRFEFDVPKVWNVIFNTRLEKEEMIGNDHRRCFFKETPVLHPGSLAFVMGTMDKFEHRFQLRNGRMMHMNIHHPKFEHFGTMKMADFAKRSESYMFEMMEKIFQGFCDYFDRDNSYKRELQFPLEKLDWIVTPNYDMYGAGFYGLINMHNDYFWMDKIQTDLHKKIKVASIMALYIARHYFGHYLNFNSWDDLHVQESFMTFFKYLIMDRIFPEYRMFDNKFVNDELYSAMKFDMMPSTMPFAWTDKVHTMNKATIEKRFFNESADEHYLERTIRYGKGAVILRMLRDFITPAVFDDVMVEMLHKYQYRSIKPEEFWLSFEYASKKPVTRMMETWFHKEAFPIVHINGKMADNGDYLVTLKQENILNHFKRLNKFARYEEFAGKWDDYLRENVHKFWCIPLQFDFGRNCNRNMEMNSHNDCLNLKRKTTALHYMEENMMMHLNEIVNKDFIFDREEMTVTIPACIYKATGGYFKISPKTYGYCVFNYPEEHIRKHFWPVPVQNMNQKQTMNIRPTMDQLRFMNDIFTLWKVGVYTTPIFFDMLKSYAMVMVNKSMRDVAVWKMIVKYMFELREVCIENQDEDLFMKLQKFARFLVKEIREFIVCERFWDFEKEKDYRFGVEDEQLVGMLAHFLVVFRDTELEKLAVQTFFKWFQSGEYSKKMFAKDLHKSMFVAAAHTNEVRALDAFTKLYREFYTFPEARENVIYAMGFFTAKPIIEKLLQWCLTDEVMTEDRLYMLKSLMMHYPVTRDMTFNFMKTKFDMFKNYNMKFFGRDFFERMPFYYADDKKVVEVLNFFADKMPVDKLTGKQFWLNQRFFHLGYEFVQFKRQWFLNNQKLIKESLEKL